MDSQLATSVLVRGPGEGPATWAMGSLFERLASGEETGGTFGMSLITQPPGVATPLHVHSREAEAFYLLDGTLTYQAGGR
jgi:quercetin dioxygenase-like cupin family protein